MYVVYALEDPRDHRIFYVGVTQDIEHRYIAHLRCLGDNAIKNEWVDDLKAHGFLPIMRTLETLHDRTKALQRETYWIHHFSYLKMPLTNEVGPVVEKLTHSPLKDPNYKTEMVRRMIEEEYTQIDILQEVWRCGDGGAKLQKAAEEFRTILVSLMPSGELDNPTLERMREMIRSRAMQNQITKTLFSGMSQSESAKEYRKYLASLVTVSSSKEGI